MSKPPSPNGRNGRDAHGRFAKGNPGGPGNPQAATVAKLRNALLLSVTENDIREVVGKLVSLAKAGNICATKLVLDRTLGSVSQKIESHHEGEIDIKNSDRIRIVENSDWYRNADRLSALSAQKN